MFLVKYLILSKFLCVNKGGHNHNKQILTKFLFLESFVKYVNYEYFFSFQKSVSHSTCMIMYVSVGYTYSEGKA